MPVKALEAIRKACDDVGAVPIPIYPFTVTVSVEASPRVVLPATDNIPLESSCMA